MAARRCAFDGDTLVAAIRATLRRRHTALPDGGMVALSERFVRDEGARANWKAFIRSNRPGDFDSLDQVVFELRRFLLAPLEHARTERTFTATWNPPAPWLAPAG